jgi:hypothetical protein
LCSLRTRSTCASLAANGRPNAAALARKRAQRSVDRADANAVLIGKLGHRRALAVPVGDNLLLTVL